MDARDLRSFACYEPDETPIAAVINRRRAAQGDPPLPTCADYERQEAAYHARRDRSDRIGERIFKVGAVLVVASFVAATVVLATRKEGE